MVGTLKIEKDRNKEIENKFTTQKAKTKHLTYSLQPVGYKAC